MIKISRVVPLLVAAIIISCMLFSTALAAEQTIVKPSKLTLKIAIEDSKAFWDFVYLTKAGDFVKPASVVVVWSLGDISSNSKYEVAVKQGKPSGELVIITEKGAYVNYRISVRDVKNKEIGSLSMQVRNTGQTEYASITHPEYTEPTIVYGNEAAPHPSEP